MDEMLTSVGLSKDVQKAFRDNNVGAKEAIGLKDSEFVLLGVCNIGDRVRIRQKCTAYIENQSVTSPVVRNLRTITKNRRFGKKKTATEETTLRILAGWKHEDYSGDLKLVYAGYGGGQLKIDLAKNSTAQDILKAFRNVFFPNGKNESKGLFLKDLSSRVATFSGRPLCDFFPGKDFTLGDLFFELKTHPVRLYLQTHVKHEESSEEDLCDDLPDVFQDIAAPVKQSQIDQPGQSTSRVQQPDTPTVSFPRHEKSTTVGSYEAYVSLLEDEDEDVALAVDRSLQDVNMDGNEVTEEPELKQKLSELKEKLSDLVQGSPCTIVIHRKRVWSSTLRAVNADGFSFWRPIQVTFAGEEAEDDGGPTREFFKLLMAEMKTKMGIFEVAGTSGMLTFSHSLDLLRQQLYKLAGQYTTWSFVHGGPSLAALPPCMFAAMIGREDELDMGDIEYLSDVTATQNLTKLKNCSSQEQFNGALAEVSDWLLEQGVNRVFNLDIEKKDRLCRDVLVQQMYYRVQPSISQFVDGLGPLWTEVKRSPRVSSALFVYDDTKLTQGELKKISEVNYSPRGSNNRGAEEDSIYSFEVFLQDCYEKKSPVSLEKLLDFWTSADKIPPCGFEKPLVVDFYTRVTGVRRLPFSHTCGPVLWLPRGLEDPDEMRKLLEYAVLNCHGFGKI